MEVNPMNQQIETLIKEIANVKLNEMFQKFDNAKDFLASPRREFESLIDVAKNFADMKTDRIPQVISQKLLVSLQNLNSILKEYENFQHNPQRTMQEQATQLNQMFQPGSAGGHQHTNHLSRYSLNFDNLISYLAIAKTFETKIGESVAAELQASRDSAKTTLEELEKIVSHARMSAGKAGIDRHSALFSSLSIRYEKDANTWLVSAIVFAVASMVLFIVMWCIGQGQTQLNLSELGPKLGMVSLLFSITIWCGRSYKTLKHLAVQHSHKAAALETFRTFADAIEDDPHIRNAVLLECTRSIFSAPNSGYIEMDKSDTSPTSVVEIFRGIDKK